jgi:hypothetical protein
VRRLPRSAGLFVERTEAEPELNRRYRTPVKCVPSIYNFCSIQKGLLNLPKVECLTLVSRYSGARGISGALGFSAMLRYTVAGRDNQICHIRPFTDAAMNGHLA